MSGETQAQESGWTTDTLKALADERYAVVREKLNEMDLRYQQRFDSSNVALTAALIASEKAVVAALAAAKEAVVKAENASEKRFESVNEFRAALTDQSSRLLTRVEAEQRFVGIAEAILRLEKFQSQQIGAKVEQLSAQGPAESQTKMWTAIAAIIVTVLIAAAGGVIAIINRLPHVP